MCINVYNIISIYILYILNYHCYFIRLFLYSLDSDCVFFTIQRSREMQERGSLLSWLSLGVRPLHLSRFSSEMASNLRLHKCATKNTMSFWFKMVQIKYVKISSLQIVHITFFIWNMRIYSEPHWSQIHLLQEQVFLHAVYTVVILWYILSLYNTLYIYIRNYTYTNLI